MNMSLNNVSIYQFIYYSCITINVKIYLYNAKYFQKKLFLLLHISCCSRFSTTLTFHYYYFFADIFADKGLQPLRSSCYSVSTQLQHLSGHLQPLQGVVYQCVTTIGYKYIFRFPYEPLLHIPAFCQYEVLRLTNKFSHKVSYVRKGRGSNCKIRHCARTRRMNEQDFCLPSSSKDDK